MAAYTFADVDSVPDILDQTRFKLILGIIPGSNSSQDLSIKCQNCVSAGMSHEAFEANLHGFVKKFRGRKVFPRTLTATFYEDVTHSTLNKLHAWNERIVGTNSGNSSGYLSDYSVTATQIKYDTTGRAINTASYLYFMPQDVPDITMDGASSAPVSVSVTFSYVSFTTDGYQVL